MKKTTHRIAAVLLSSLVGAGCGGLSDENLSGQATADPAKLQKAQAEAQEAAAKAQAAEAAKLKGRIQVEDR